MSPSPSSLISSTYGKDNVRFFKVKKDPQNGKKHDVMEASVMVLLEGAFDSAYTEADNRDVVPTDTVKNTVLVLAKTTEVWPIEKFAAKLATHFVDKYGHVSGASVQISQERWVKYHDHSFIHEGSEKRITHLHYTRDGDFTLESQISGLTVLKSTNSQFHGYNVCDFTTLKPTTDRILSTDVDARWKFSSKQLGSIYNIAHLAEKGLFDEVYEKAREITLKRFALEDSASVQATMFNMATEILEVAPSVETVSYSLPNKHYLLVDLAWKGLDNDNELFYPSPHPNGLIKCTVGRNPKNKL